MLGACLIIGFNALSQQANDSTQLWQISTTDGNNFTGLIISETHDEIHFKTFAYGDITINKVLIISKKELSDPKKRQKKQKKTTSESSSPISKEDATWRIVTNDGFDFVGKIINKDNQVIELETIKFGTIKIQRLSIKNMNIVTEEQMVGGDVWFENPQGTRYFYSPNGYGLKKGEGYYQNIWVLVNQVSVGITDYITMGVGTVPVFLFGEPILPLWITPKVSIPIVKDKFNVGAGALLFSLIGEDETFGLVYGVATYGDRNTNVNVGVGYAFTEDGWAKKPTITISTMLRTGKKGYFISENFIINDGNETIVLLSFGGRTVWPRMSLDYGLVIPVNVGAGLIAIPWLGFVIPFGNNQKQVY